LQRQRVKRLIAELEVEHPEIKNSMVRALANVAPRHLLDTRLNPPADLRATVPLDALQPPPARKSRRLLPVVHQ
jgi:tRNA(Ile)-lysidine synthase TilS/MesJ